MLTLEERQERIKVLANEMALGGPALYESWVQMLSAQTDEYLLRRIYELHARRAKLATSLDAFLYVSSDLDAI